MPYSTLFFDLDDTLYPATSGLWEAIRDRMSRYMWERLNLPKEEVPELRKYYFETYGTTLRGLQIHHGVDADEYLSYVHDLPLQSYIQPDPGLRKMILSLSPRRWIFTNADDHHAQRVLAELGLGDCFSGIIDIRAIQFACKPEIVAYQRAMALAGEVEPSRCVLLDDSPRNLAPAREMGFFTILIGSGKPDPAASLSLPSVIELPSAMPELWNGRPK
jgi:putative hydrolase of the HAD superfamily